MQRFKLDQTSPLDREALDTPLARRPLEGARHRCHRWRKIPTMGGANGISPSSMHRYGEGTSPHGSSPLSKPVKDREIQRPSPLQVDSSSAPLPRRLTPLSKTPGSVGRSPLHRTSFFGANRQARVTPEYGLGESRGESPDNRASASEDDGSEVSTPGGTRRRLASPLFTTAQAQNIRAALFGTGATSPTKMGGAGASNAPRRTLGIHLVQAAHRRIHGFWLTGPRLMAWRIIVSVAIGFILVALPL